MAGYARLNDNQRDDVLQTIMVAIGLVLGSKPGGKVDPSRDMECAVNVLNSLEGNGYEVVTNADRT